MTRLLSWFTAPATRRISIRLLILSAAWAIVFYLIDSCSTVKPRLTFPMHGEIVGITPDSRELVALSFRIQRHSDELRDENGMRLHNENLSGPLQIWNLQTGETRIVCLPFQDCIGRFDRSFERPTMVDPEGWQAKPMETPFRGRWLQLNFETDLNRRIHRKPEANVLVDLDTGDCHRATDDEHFDFVSGLELSQTSRWYIELQQRIPLWSERVPSRLRILETATAKEMLAFDVPRDWPSWVFSPNDQLLAYETADKKNCYRVWQLDPSKLLYEIEDSHLTPTFSNDGQLLAALIEEAQQSKIVIFDAASGLRLVEHPFTRTPVSQKHFISLQFSADNNWLYLFQSESLRIVMGSGPFHFDYDLSFAIDLRTNTRHDFSTVTVDPRYFPRHYKPDSLPALVLDDAKSLLELPTGRRLGQLPEEEDSIALTRDGRILLVEWQDFQGISMWSRVLEFLESVHVPIPASWWYGTSYGDAEWIFRELPSNRTLVRMPAQKQVHWLSPDERTLVTQPLDDSPVVHVWDFPPRKPWRPAALWALIAPGVLILIGWFRHWRKSRRDHGAMIGGAA